MASTKVVATQDTAPPYIVRNSTRNQLKLIPYIGCKAGFSHIFDDVIPDKVPGRIYDVFGGGGSFTFYACKRFGSHRVTYNDNNPVLVNLLHWLQKDPDELWRLYQQHYDASSPEYFYEVRKQTLQNDLASAARFLYLAKNAFSGKIRFNSKNQFNTPIRKGSRCPRIDIEYLRALSELIKDAELVNRDYQRFSSAESSFLYLDPPYFNNSNGHYNNVLSLSEFNEFLSKVAQSNLVLLSEQNEPDLFGLDDHFTIREVHLRRSLQYFTQSDSREIVAFNY